MGHSGPSQSSPLPWAGCPQPHPRPRAPPGMGIHNNPRSLSSNTQSSHRQTEERLSLHSIWTWSAWHWTTNYLVIKLITSYAPSVKPAHSCLVHKLKQPSSILQLKKGAQLLFKVPKFSTCVGSVRVHSKKGVTFWYSPWTSTEKAAIQLKQRSVSHPHVLILLHKWGIL